MKPTHPKKMPGDKRPKKGKCGSKLRKSLEKYGQIRYCVLFPVRGRTRCRLHGGATLQGMASATYRGKGYSQSVPKHLKDIYEARLNDPELLSLHKGIALCDTRIEDLLTQISGRMGDYIDQVTACFLAFQVAYEADKLEGEVGDLARAIRRLKEDRSTWTEIREEQKNMARLVGVAQRVEFAEGRAVTMETLMSIQSEILNLIRNTVFGWEGQTVRPHVFLQEFQTAFIRRFGLDTAKVVE